MFPSVARLSRVYSVRAKSPRRASFIWTQPSSSESLGQSYGSAPRMALSCPTRPWTGSLRVSVSLISVPTAFRPTLCSLSVSRRRRRRHCHRRRVPLLHPVPSLFLYIHPSHSCTGPCVHIGTIHLVDLCSPGRLVHPSAGYLYWPYG